MPQCVRPRLLLHPQDLLHSCTAAGHTDDQPKMHPETHAQALAEGAAGMDQLQLGACLMMDSWVGSVSLPLAWPKYMKFSTLRAVRWMRVSFFPGQATLSKLICTKGACCM